MVRIRTVLAFFTVLFAAAGVSSAQVRDRWHLDWKNEKPEMFLYRTADDKIEPYWFVSFDVYNPTHDSIPLILDVVLYVESGKEMMHDVRKVESDTIKDALASDRYDILILKDGDKIYGAVGFRENEYVVRTAHETRRISADKVEKWLKRPTEVKELLKYGRFHPSILHPEVEPKVIEYVAGLGNRSPGIVLESIESFKKGFDRDPRVADPAAKVYLIKDSWLRGRWKKGDRLFLNPKELREQRFVHPGQRIGGIALFKNVNPRAQSVEVQVSGLVDIIKVERPSPKEMEVDPDLALPKIVYENQVLKLRYQFKGDEYNRMEDVVVFQSREWVVKRLGPVADKETLQLLVDAMVSALQRERDWKERNKSAEEIDALRAKEGIGAFDLRIIAQSVRLATGKEFGYDSTKGILENEASIWRIHEWWLTNKSKLVYNEATNRYDISGDVLPGTVEPKDKP